MLIPIETYSTCDFPGESGPPVHTLWIRPCAMSTKISLGSTGAKWLSGRVLDSRPRVAGSSITGVTALCPCARHINP